MHNGTFKEVADESFEDEEEELECELVSIPDDKTKAPTPSSQSDNKNDSKIVSRIKEPIFTEHDFGTIKRQYSFKVSRLQKK